MYLGPSLIVWAGFASHCLQVSLATALDARLTSDDPLRPRATPHTIVKLSKSYVSSDAGTSAPSTGVHNLDCTFCASSNQGPEQTAHGLDAVIWFLNSFSDETPQTIVDGYTSEEVIADSYTVDRLKIVIASSTAVLISGDQASGSHGDPGSDYAHSVNPSGIYDLKDGAKYERDKAVGDRASGKWAVGEWGVGGIAADGDSNAFDMTQASVPLLTRPNSALVRSDRLYAAFVAAAALAV